MIVDFPVDICTIMRNMPHRYPFLLVDKVISAQAGKEIIALKNVTINENFFSGHFPDYPVMPGVLTIEGMAQTAGLLLAVTYGVRKDNEIFFLVGMDKVRFKKQIIPGDTIIYKVELLKIKNSIARFNAVATVNDEVAASAEIILMRREV